MVLVSPKFQGPEWRGFRLKSFICTGLSAIAPIGHATLLWGTGFVARVGVPYYFAEGLLLLIGCYFYKVCEFFRFLFKNVRSKEQ